MTVSRLLKSCATPPASRPTASIFLLGLPELLLQPLAIGHVGDHRDAADHVALGIELRRVPESHVDQRAVLTAALALDAGNGLAGPESRQIVAEKGLVLFGHDGEGLADNLLLEPAEDPLSGPVPAPHVAAEVHRDNGQGAGVDDDPEHMVGPAQFVFGIPAPGEVRAGSDDELDAAVACHQRGIGPGDQAPAPVAVDPVVLKLVGKAPRPQVVKHGPDGGDLLRWQHHVPDEAAAHLFEGAAGCLLAGAVEADDAPLIVEHDYQAGHRFHHRCGPVALPSEGFLVALEGGDVAEDNDPALEPAGLIPQRHGRGAHPSALRLAGAHEHLDIAHLFAPDGTDQRKLFGRKRRGPVGLVETVAGTPLRERDVSRSAAQQPLRRGIDQNEPAVLVRDHGAVAQAGQNGLQERSGMRRKRRSLTRPGSPWWR
jgi:hypothetical protein